MPHNYGLRTKTKHLAVIGFGKSTWMRSLPDIQINNDFPYSSEDSMTGQVKIENKHGTFIFIIHERNHFDKFDNIDAIIFMDYRGQPDTAILSQLPNNCPVYKYNYTNAYDGMHPLNFFAELMES